MDTLDGKADPAQVRRQLDKIVKSASLAGAVRLQELLAYTVEEALAGRGAELKETVIGAEVFNRAGHDPRLDSIVRVTASKLRARLREYYLTEGLNDPLEIEFPRGGYAPVVRWRSPSRPARRGPNSRQPRWFPPIPECGGSRVLSGGFLRRARCWHVWQRLNGKPAAPANWNPFAFRCRLPRVCRSGHFPRQVGS